MKKKSLYVIALFWCMVDVQGALTESQIDSGWVLLYNEQNLSGLYTYTDKYKSTNWVQGLNNDVDQIFKASGSVLDVKGTSLRGYIGTQKDYSHYRVRVTYQFESATGFSQNAGVLVHSQPEHTSVLYGSANSVLSLFNNRWPVSLEVQGQKRGMGELWAIGGIQSSIEHDPSINSCKYKVGGIVKLHPTSTSSSSRQCKSNQPDNSLYKNGEWNVLEVLVRGSDSLVHIANGKEVLKIKNTFRGSNYNSSTRVESGRIHLQSEGASVQYKNFMIQELDPVTGVPIHAKRGCTDNRYDNFDSRAVVNNGSCQDTVVSSVNTLPGNSHLFIYRNTPLYDVNGRKQFFVGDEGVSRPISSKVMFYSIKK